MMRKALPAALLMSVVAGLGQVNAAESGSERTQAWNHAEPIPQTDLAVTDIFLDRLRNGHLWVRITNHGPNVVHGRRAELIVVVDGGSLLVDGPLNVAPGQTRTLNTGMVVDASKRVRDITVTVRVPGMRDLNPSNNTYRERVP